MYVISGENRDVLYIANYRVGSTALAGTLMNMGATQVNGHHGLPEGHFDLSGWLVVQTVRHHCDVIASAWYKNNTHIPFADYLKTILDGKNPYFHPEGFYNRYPCNYILRYETLQFEFDILCSTAGLPRTELLVDPSTRPKSLTWQRLFNYEQTKAVYKMFQHEMDFYGYSMTGNTPERKQCLDVTS